MNTAAEALAAILQEHGLTVTFVEPNHEEDTFGVMRISTEQGQEIKIESVWDYGDAYLALSMSTP